MRWNKQRQGRFSRYSPTQGVGAGKDVTEAFGFVVEQRDGDRQAAERQIDFDKSGQSPDDGVPEADGSAVVAHDPQSSRQLTERQAAGHRFNGYRDHHKAKDNAYQNDGSHRSFVDFPPEGGDEDEDEELRQGSG